MRQITKGAADQSTILRILDATDNSPETGVTSATAGLALSYRREGGAVVALTESDLAAVDSAHSDGGMIHIGAGYYRVDLPDAAVATGADGVLVFGVVTGMVVIAAYHELVNAKITGDPYARLGAPAGASVSADIAAVKAETASIQTDTNDLQTQVGVAGAGLTAINLPDQTMNITGDITGNLSGSVGSVTGAVGSVTGAVGSVTGSVGSVATDGITSGSLAATAITEIQSGLSTLDAAGVRTAVGLAAANLDTQLAAIDDAVDTEIASIISTLATILAAVDTEVAAIKAKTDQLTFTNANKLDSSLLAAADLAAAVAEKIADALLDRNMATGSDSGSATVRTVRQALRALRNKVSISGGTLTTYKEDDSTASWTGAVTTAAGDPISAVDPADA